MKNSSGKASQWKPSRPTSSPPTRRSPPATVTRIETFLAQLASAGQTALAAQLRQQHAAKLAPPKKPWWKLGR